MHIHMGVGVHSHTRHLWPVCRQRKQWIGCIPAPRQSLKGKHPRVRSWIGFHAVCPLDSMWHWTRGGVLVWKNAFRETTLPPLSWGSRRAIVVLTLCLADLRSLSDTPQLSGKLDDNMTELSVGRVGRLIRPWECTVSVNWNKPKAFAGSDLGDHVPPSNS